MFDSFFSLIYNLIMSLLPFWYFFTVLVYLYLAVYALIKNPKALTNRIFALIMGCFIVWSTSLIFIHNHAVSFAAAKLFLHISAPAWIGFSSFFVWFMLSFAGKKKILKKKWLYLLIFGIPLVLLFIQWNGGLMDDLRREYYGWKPLYASTPWPHFYYIYYVSFMATGLYLNAIFIRDTRSPALKQQAKIMFVTIVITLILGSITDLILPLLNIHLIPNIASSLVLIWAFGVVYAMAKYKFLTITPATAAENIISTMFDCLILLDLSGRITAVNTSTLNILGYSEKELKGAPITRLIKDEQEEAVKVNVPANKWVESIIHEEGGSRNHDVVFKTKEGHEVPILLSSTILKDESGTAAGVVCVAKDISERKSLEDEKLKSKKLESVGLLAGGIAHDFNNLLSVILGNIALAKEGIPADKKVHELLLNAEEASELAAELAGKFITFSRGGWLKKEKIFLHRLISELKLSSLQDAGDISIHMDIPKDLEPVYGDEEQLLQVMHNLLLNAVEAIPPNRKGQVFVSAQPAPEEKIANLPLKKGKYVLITVQDNGTGIPPRHLEKIFDPYFSTKDLGTQKGMGLGLTICYSIIRKHEGHIAIESEQGRWTIISVYLPVYEEETVTEDS
jgi:PAS domain S-box-containing protein